MIKVIKPRVTTSRALQSEKDITVGKERVGQKPSRPQLPVVPSHIK